MSNSYSCSNKISAFNNNNIMYKPIKYIVLSKLEEIASKLVNFCKYRILIINL